jgi:WD40 repeat protein
MNRPLPLLSLLLLALLTIQLLRCVRAEARTGARAAKPTPMSKTIPMRLVVQQGQRRVSNGFTLFSPDGRLVATGDNGGDVVVWDVASGREVRRLTRQLGRPRRAGRGRLAVGRVLARRRAYSRRASGRTLRLWDLRTGKRLWLATNGDNAFFEPDDGSHPPVAFASGGTQVVVTGTQYKLTWDARTGRLLSRVRSSAARKEARILRPSPAAQRGLARRAASSRARRTDSSRSRRRRRASVVGRVRFLVMGPGYTSSYPGQPWHDELYALAVSPDGRTLITADRGDGATRRSHFLRHHVIRLWDVKTGTALHRLTGTDWRLFELPLHEGGRACSASRTNTGAYSARELLSGKEATWRAAGDTSARQDVSADGRFVVTGAGLVGEVWDTQTGERVARVEAKLDPGEKADTAEWTSSALRRSTPSPSSATRPTASRRPSRSARATGRRRSSRSSCRSPTTTHRFVMTPDTRAAAWETVEGGEDGSQAVQRVNVWRADEPARVRSFKVDSDEAYTDASHLLLSPDGERVLVATANNGGNVRQMLIKVYDVDAGSCRLHAEAAGFRVGSSRGRPTVASSPRARARARATARPFGRQRRARSCAGSTGRGLGRRLLARRPLPARLSATTASSASTKWRRARSLCRFITRSDGSWVVVDPEGRFDASDLDEIQGVHWLAPEDPLKPLALEIFMRDYYEPRLLARIIAGEQFAPVRSLAEVNRAQPSVHITSIEQQKERPELARVTRHPKRRATPRRRARPFGRLRPATLPRRSTRRIRARPRAAS